MFLSKTKFGEAQKRFGGHYPRMPPVSAGQGRTIARMSSVGGFMFVQGARHSENVCLIHNMHSNCRLCKLIYP